MARRFVTKHLVANDRTTDILSEQLRAGDLQGEGEMEVVNLVDIIPSSNNPRKIPWNEQNFEALSSGDLSSIHPLEEKWHELISLSQSINQHGLMQPIILKRIIVDDKEKFEIIAGERRYWACRLLNRSVIRAIIRKVDTQTQNILAMTENLAREDLSLLEKVNGLKELQNYSVKYHHLGEIQALLGISRTQAFRLKKVIDSDHLYQLVIKGKITQISDIDKYDIEEKNEKPRRSSINITRWSLSKDQKEALLDLAKQYKPDLYELLIKKHERNDKHEKNESDITSTID